MKTALITGANAGIGLETARSLARSGFRVLLHARNREKGEAARQSVRQSAGHDEVHLFLADFSRLDDVRELADKVLQAQPRLDVLVNNAGLVSAHRQLTPDGYEQTFAVNHLAPFLLTNLLLDRLKASAPARVVNVASRGHKRRGPLPLDDLMGEREWAPFRAYAHSKLANILFNRELARRLKGSGVTANSVHPGLIRTDIGSDGDLSGWRRLGWKVVMRFAKTVEEGAATSILLASSEELEGVTGAYFAEGKRTEPALFAQDDEAAARLWQLSLPLVGLPAEAEEGPAA
jgi:NAD(P)-dependent dehydrogenase (short-subunit alcohol dehydrogenase family)